MSDKYTGIVEQANKLEKRSNELFDEADAYYKEHKLKTASWRSDDYQHWLRMTRDAQDLHRQAMSTLDHARELLAEHVHGIVSDLRKQLHEPTDTKEDMSATMSGADTEETEETLGIPTQTGDTGADKADTDSGMVTVDTRTIGDMIEHVCNSLHDTYHTGAHTSVEASVDERGQVTVKVETTDSDEEDEDATDDADGMVTIPQSDVPRMLDAAMSVGIRNLATTLLDRHGEITADVITAERDRLTGKLDTSMIDTLDPFTRQLALEGSPQMSVAQGMAGMGTPSQAAEYLGRSVATLATWRSRGLDTDLGYRKYGRQVLYDPDEVRAFYQRRCERRRATLPQDCERLNTKRKEKE